MLRDANGTTNETTGYDLLAIVETAFPRLAAGTIRVDRTGGDHVVLVVDDRIAFRFPRRGMHDLTLEIEISRRLQSLSVPSTPSYDYVDPDGRFAGYPFIPGTELTPQRFASLSPACRDTMLSEAARFLSELHRLEPSAIGDIGSWPKAWTAAQFADRGMTERLPRIGLHFPELRAPIGRFYTRYGQDRPPAPVVIHGDLVAEHMLVDEQTGRLTGIIDFGDVALGDPAQDFLGFWAYGAHAAVRAVELYRPTNTDPGLLARSRQHFIRYRLDRLVEALDDDPDPDRTHAAAEIAALLHGRRHTPVY